MVYIPLRARAVALALVLVGSAAQAGEQVSMPFDCVFAGGRARLIPAQFDHSYGIIGPHERQVFSTCSPSDPQNCRSWLVHRFAFECNGSRVTWLEAAGNAARGENWDAWVEDGRFNMRMSKGWAVAPVRRRPDRWGGWRGRFAGPGIGMEYGRDDYRPDRIVTLPAGYAPAMGIPLTFNGGAPDGPVALAPSGPGKDGWAAEPHSADAYAPPLGSTPRADAPARVPPPPSAQASPPDQPGAVAHAPLLAGPAAAAPSTAADLPEHAPRQAATPAAAPPPAKQAAAPVPEPAASKPVVPEPKPSTVTVIKPEPDKPAVTADAQPGGTSTTPRILNGAHHEAASPPAPVIAAATPSASTTSSVPPAEPDAISKTLAAADQPADETSVSQAPETGALPAAAATVEKHAIASGTVAAVIALLGLAAFGLWRRQRVTAIAAPRDISSITLERSTTPATISRAPVRAEISALPTPGSPPAGPSLAAVEEFPVPKTYEQALKVLGAAPEASVIAIKKIVDGLRLNWHPDHASSEPDRLYRERRLQQINAAWDIVAKQRAAATAA